MKVTGTTNEIIFLLERFRGADVVEVTLCFKNEKKGVEEYTDNDVDLEMPEFYKLVKVELINQNMKIVDLARIIGKSQSYISQVISGIKNDRTCREKIREVLGIKK